MAENPKEKIQWHPAFYAAAELEFRENRDDLKFEREYNLSKEPIRMDMLIVKKTKGVRIKNEIGHIFKEYNVIEYKSPSDGLTIDDFFKTIGYACFYKGLGKTVDAVPANELTVTIFREGKPVEMFKALKALGGTIEEKYHGIYYIKGITIFSTQVIVTKELDKKTHSSLRVLTENANEDDVRIFLESTEDIETPGDKDNVDAILQASISANKEVYDNVREVINMSDVVREFFQPAFDKAVKEEAAKVAAEKAEEMAREIAEEKAKEIAEEKAKELADEKVEENAVEFIKAIMDSLNIDVDEAMDKLKISESSRDMLKKKIVATM
jgi:hypothetical protein